MSTPDSWIYQSSGYLIKQLLLRLRAQAEQRLKPCGLTIPQYAVLAWLEAAPGSSNADMAKRCDVTPQTMNGIILNLEKAGLIRRKDAPDHGRIKKAELTAAGRKVLQKAHQCVMEAEQCMLAPLSITERKQFKTLLNTCLQTLRELDAD